jgi:hypothetical protein
VRRQVMSQPVRRRGTPGPIELRRMRGGVFRMGRFVGLDTRALVGFSEVGTDHRSRRWSSNDVEQVLADAVAIASVIHFRSRGTPKRTPEIGDWKR